MEIGTKLYMHDMRHTMISGRAEVYFLVMLASMDQ